jgi:phosphoglucosamine mutase
VVAARERIEARLAGRGRVVLRASGTEPVIRVMVEADDRAEAESAALELARVLKESAP